MGYYSVRLEVTGSQSAHNSDQDRIDESLWEEFCDRVLQISREHRYASLRLDMSHSGR